MHYYMQADPAGVQGAAGAGPGTSFAFKFDGTPDNTVTPPFTGSGTFSFTGAPKPDGIYPLTGLPGFAFSFSLDGGMTLGTANIATPLAGVQVRLQTVGSAQTARFASNNDGFKSGSIDLGGGTNWLTFEPDFGFMYMNSQGLMGTYECVVSRSCQPAHLCSCA